MRFKYEFDRAKAEKDEAYFKKMKRRCQTDILFLAHMLGYDKMVEEVHGLPISLCVQKNPDLPMEQQLPADVDRDFIHLDPRGIFKTTLSIVDAIQWLICFPNIAICKLTATKPLANAIVGTIADHFVRNGKGASADFQLLFPEFLIAATAKKTGEYTAPCRTIIRNEATVMAFSNETTISGWHFDVFDPDDIVDTKNSKTPNGIQTVKDNYATNSYTAMPWTYFNFKGTRYNPFDFWGMKLEEKKRAGGKTRVVVRAALTVKNGKRLEPGKFPTEKEVELLFPTFLTYAFLKKKFDENYASFMTQYMNDAFGGHDVIFSADAMINATVPVEETPIVGEMICAWRFAYSDEAMYAAGGVAILDNGRLYVVDCVRGQWRPSNMAHEVMTLAKKWGCHNVRIELTPGAAYLEDAIKNYGIVSQWPISITWLEFQEDDHARELMVKRMEPLIATKRLLFSDEVQASEELDRQFLNYGMIADREIPEVVARLAEALPKSIMADESTNDQALAWELLKQREVHDKMFGIGQYAPMPEVETEAPHEAIDIMAL